jgi:hypothetical protein
MLLMLQTEWVSFNTLLMHRYRYRAITLPVTGTITQCNHCTIHMGKGPGHYVTCGVPCQATDGIRNTNGGQLGGLATHFSTLSTVGHNIFTTFTYLHPNSSMIIPKIKSSDIRAAHDILITIVRAQESSAYNTLIRFLTC